MGDLSEHFSRWEFSCRCGCGFDTVDYETIIVLEDLRAYFDDAALYITSGCRCLDYNEVVQKKDNPNYIPYSSKSMHMWGRALDVKVEGVPSDKVFNYLCQKYPGKYGIGSYASFTHLDTGSGGPRRW